MALLEDEKRIVKKGKRFLEKNDVNGFAEFVSDELGIGNVLKYHVSYRNIMDWLIEQIPEIVSYCKNEVPDNIFFYCTELEKAHVAPGVKRIGELAFSRCINLEEVTLPDSLETIDSGAFMATNISSIIIPDSVTFISDSVFGDCSELKEVKLSKNIKFIGVDSFYNCPHDLKIYLPKSVKIKDIDWEEYKDYRDNIVRI